MKWKFVTVLFIVYSKNDGRIIGQVDGPWPECRSKEKDESIVPESLAQYVIQFFLVSTDSNVTVPLGYYPTRGVTHAWLTQRKFRTLL